MNGITSLKPSALVLGIFIAAFDCSAETFRIATYNVANYLDKATESRRDVKSPDAQAKVRESILAMKTIATLLLILLIGTTTAAATRPPPVDR